MRIPTERFLEALMRVTSVDEEVRECYPEEGGVMDHGSYISTTVYRVVFAGGEERTYWIRAGAVTEIRPKVARRWE